MSEPDYRFTLANERTFLAWVRTSLGLLAAALFVLHLIERDLVSLLLAFLLLLPFYGRLEDAGRAWWVWTCLCGFGLGVVGWIYCRLRRDRRQARAA